MWEGVNRTRSQVENISTDLSKKQAARTSAGSRTAHGKTFKIELNREVADLLRFQGQESYADGTLLK